MAKVQSKLGIRNCELRIVLKTRRTGFTILEALVACVIFVSIFVPLMSFLYKDSYFVRDRDKLTALCLLDQEAKTLQVFPQLYAPIKKKEINGMMWEIKTEVQGKDLLLFKVNVFKKDNFIKDVTFRVYQKKIMN